VAEFVKAARLDELPVGQGTVVTIASKDVALFNVDGTVYAMENACLHQGGSLGFSPLDGCVVTCRAHGWRYDVTTGNTLHVPDYGVQTYPVKVVDGTIMIALATPSPTA
jgi:3-phenylpropionate/trans-cinnamate dioxygenase ferredoxin subunit